MSAGPEQDDRQRCLDERGISEAGSVRRAIAELGLPVDAVICSDAARTRQTLEIVRPVLLGDHSQQFDHQLFAGGIEAYEAAARRSTGRVLLLVGHNPMIAEFARTLCGDGERQAMARMTNSFSTATLAVIASPVPLSEIKPLGGRLVSLFQAGET